MQTTDAIRDELLELHRLLLEEMRGDYERVHGKLTPGQFLNLLMNDEDFRWLQSLTAIIVELDEQKSATVDKEWADRARELLRPDAAGSAFQKRYEEFVQRSPDVSIAHGAAMRAMS